MNSYRFSCHKNQSTFSKNVNYLFGVSNENFGVSVDNVGVSGMVAAGVSGTTPMMLLSSYTLGWWGELRRLVIKNKITFKLLK